MKSCQELKRKWKEEKKENWFFIYLLNTFALLYSSRPLVIIGEYKQKKIGHLTLIRLQRHTL